MANLFKRAAVFCDLHLGKKNNDRQHNVDCENFILWFIKTAQDNNADCVIFLGDWHDNRHAIHVSTLNYSLSNLEHLNNMNIPVYFIPGNHDEFYKERRELNSISIARNLTNIRIFNDITILEDVVFCPWLVADEWKKVAKLTKSSTYIFGHFELPHFMMNAAVEMPDHGGLNYEHFNELKGLALTGHFHKRQSKGKVLYMGNAFPHNFSDTWDDERGMVLLDWGQSPVFHKWPNAPNYRTQKITELLDAPETSINDKTYTRITVDLDLPHNEIQFIKDIFQIHFNPRKLDMIPNSKEQDTYVFESEIEFQSVDQIVIEGLKNIDSVSMDKSILIDIYHSLI